MIVKETKMIVPSDNVSANIVSGYFLTIDDLQRLARDFQADCFDGFISNDKAYIEQWLNNHKRIIK